MSSQTASPDVPVDEPSTVESPADAGTDAGAENAATGDDLPFESPEFGVGGFLPHLDTADHG